MNQEKLCFLPLRKALTFLWLLRIPEMQKGQICWTFLNECLQNESSDHEWNQMWKVFKKNLLKAAWSIPWAFFLLRLWISRMTRLRMTQLWASALQLFPWPFLWHDVAWCGAVACYEKGWKCRSMQKHAEALQLSHINEVQSFAQWDVHRVEWIIPRTCLHLLHLRFGSALDVLRVGSWSSSFQEQLQSAMLKVNRILDYFL